MEDVGIIIRRCSEWGARTKFPPKNKGSSEMNVVRNYIPFKSPQGKVAISVSSFGGGSRLKAIHRLRS